MNLKKNKRHNCHISQGYGQFFTDDAAYKRAYLTFMTSLTYLTTKQLEWQN